MQQQEQHDELLVKYISFILNTFPNFMLEQVDSEDIIYEFETLDHVYGQIIKYDEDLYTIIVEDEVVEELNQVEFDVIKPFELHNTDNIFDWVKSITKIYNENIDQIKFRLKRFIEQIIRSFTSLLSSTNQIKFLNDPKNNNVVINGNIIENTNPLFYTITPDPYPGVASAELDYEFKSKTFTIISSNIN